MYGSNFSIETRSPRSTSSRPSDAAAMPLPSDETTPPVTKMYLVDLGASRGLHRSHPVVNAVQSRFARSRSSSVSIPGRTGSPISATPIGTPAASGRNCSSRSICSSALSGHHNPLHQRTEFVRVHPDVLPDASALQLGVCSVTQERNRRSRKIHGSAVVGSDNLDDVRIVENLRRRANRGRSERKARFGHHANRRRAVASRDTNGSSPCTLTMTSKSAYSGASATSATRCVPETWCAPVSTARPPCSSTTSAISVLSVATTTSFGHVELDDALEYANDQREAGEESKRFSGETRGAQSSWDDGERPHTGRSGNCASARTAAKITFSNVAPPSRRRKPPRPQRSRASPPESNPWRRAGSTRNST